jgi:hypothetical protein
MNCFPMSKESVDSINHIFSSISFLLCMPFLIPRLTLDLVHFHTAGFDGWWNPAYRHMCRTHTVKQVAVKSLVMSVWTICVAAWKYLLICVSSVIFNFLGFLLLVRDTWLLFCTCVTLFLHALFTVLFTNTELLGAIDLLPAWKYPNGQSVHVKRQWFQVGCYNMWWVQQ